MQKIRNSSVIFLLLVTSIAVAQKKELVTNYIKTYKDLAVAEMKRTGVPAAITLAQGIHESGAGNSKLVLESNNHFGIKCKSNWTGQTVKHDDDEKKECFRKYPASEQSYKDHSDFLRNGQRYASLFLLDPTDYKGWAHGLKKAGYATNPKYPEVLIKLIEEYDLQDYTFIALGNESDTKQAVAKNEQSANNVIIAEITPVQMETDYPTGQFKINDTKVVFVRKGTSFLSIAKQFDIDLSKIFELNEIPPSEMTDNDQLIYLQRKRKTGNNDFHTVKPGETLHDIAQQQAIRLESLRELNWLNEEDKPAIGEQLNLKSRSSSRPKLVVKENYSLIPAIKNQGSN